MTAARDAAEGTGLLGEPDDATKRRGVSFLVPGVPVAKGRARFSARGGVARTYTPAKTVAYEAAVRSEAVRAMFGRPPLEGPLLARLIAYFPPLKSGPKARRGGPMTARPDADNVAKAVLDALNGVVYGDDAQVVSLHVSKARRMEGDEDPVGVFVCVEEVPA